MKRLICFLFLLMNCYHGEKNNYSGILPLLLNKPINITIIGDSLSKRSEGFRLQERLGSSYKVTDFSISGRTYVEWTHDINTPFQIPADIVIVELGTNDGQSLPTSVFRENLNQLLDGIQTRSNARIVLTAVPLTDEPTVQEKIRLNNTIIRSYNHKASIADGEAEFDRLKNSGIRLYPLTDKIHPEPAGYEALGVLYQSKIISLH